jgi:hypothetical protein
MLYHEKSGNPGHPAFVRTFETASHIRSGLPDFSWSDWENYSKRPQTIPNDHTLYEMLIKYTKRPKMYLYFALQGPPKCIKLAFFGMKICTPSGNHVFVSIIFWTAFLLSYVCIYVYR